MPANLTPEYLKAELEYKRAETIEEKVACLQRMLAVMPKHKGTDKLQAELRRRLAKLRDEAESQGRRKVLSRRIKPEGAGQIILVGPPNSGKSSLLRALTNAHPLIADYPCSTREPLPGMMEFEDILIQLVDMPPVFPGYCESFVFDNIRAANAMLLVVDITAPDPVRDFNTTLALLKDKHIEPIPHGFPATTHKGIPTIAYLLALNKADLDPDGTLAALIREEISSKVRTTVISAHTGFGLEELKRELFLVLNVIRIYTKEPGKPPDLRSPYTIPRGSTVLEFAARVHHDFAEHFKSARVWGSARFNGQAVPRDHVLADRDVVELSADTPAGFR
ncbi:MAG: TGS domain-containing protein [Kiritimatiellae bacterium]|nr:TGS domain-containing protein [Kiritimatiellia bacterium]